MCGDWLWDGFLVCFDDEWLRMNVIENWFIWICEWNFVCYGVLWWFIDGFIWGVGLWVCDGGFLLWRYLGEWGLGCSWFCWWGVLWGWFCGRCWWDLECCVKVVVWFSGIEVFWFYLLVGVYECWIWCVWWIDNGVCFGKGILNGNFLLWIGLCLLVFCFGCCGRWWRWWWGS